MTCEPLGEYARIVARREAAIASARSAGLVRKLLGKTCIWDIPAKALGGPVEGNSAGRAKRAVFKRRPRVLLSVASQIRPLHVIQAVANAAEIEPWRLCQTATEYRVSHPRHVVVLILTERFPELSSPTIGRMLGIDHTSALYARKKARLRVADPTTPSAIWYRKATETLNAMVAP